MKKSIAFFTVLLLSLLFSEQTLSQVVTPFSIRYQHTTKGGIDFVSNSIVRCNGSGSGGVNCIDLATQSPPSSESWSQNNDHVAVYIDNDSDPSTYSSSSDSLNIEDCSRILFAGIYWGGRSDNEDPDFGNRDSILIAVNGGTYSPLKAEFLIDAGADEGLGNRVYYCFSEITEIVKESPNKSVFTIANLYSRLQDGSNRWGGWNIVVVYENDDMPNRQLTVYDGLININDTGVDLEIEAVDFLTPIEGEVNFEIGVFAYDGDRGFVGDELTFDGGAGATPVFDDLNPAIDIFNSSQTNTGSISISQNPLIENNISIDADIIEPENSLFTYIGNAQTSATINASTTGESVQIQLLTLAIDVFEPNLRATIKTEDLNGGILEIGDTIAYEITGKNIGNDSSSNTYIIDTLSTNLVYVPGSIEIIAGPNLGIKTDVELDDQAAFFEESNAIRVNIGSDADGVSGGILNEDLEGSDSTTFIFRAVVSQNCVSLMCNEEIENQAFIMGSGALSGHNFTVESDPFGKDIFNCPLDGNLTLMVDISSCVFPADIVISSACGILPFDTFPYTDLGYSYFDDTFSSVSVITEPGLFYAINFVSDECSDTIQIEVLEIIDSPSSANAGEDQNICEDNAKLAGNTPTIGTGIWTVVTGSSSIVEPALFDTEVTALEIGMNTFRWTISNGSCEDNFDEITIFVEGDNDNDGICDGPDLDDDNDGILDTIEGTNDTDGDGITDDKDPDDDGDGIPTIDESDLDESGNYTDCDNDGIVDYLDADQCQDLRIAGAFSPDGDGINDFFVIQGIESYPTATIFIYNRWGSKVYESLNGYANDWDGKNRFGVTVGDQGLPVGNYYYVLDLGDESDVIRGYVFLKRQ